MFKVNNKNTRTTFSNIPANIFFEKENVSWDGSMSTKQGKSAEQWLKIAETEQQRNQSDIFQLVNTYSKLSIKILDQYSECSAEYALSYQ